jgi:hypothetical protein
MHALISRAPIHPLYNNVSRLSLLGLLLSILSWSGLAFGSEVQHLHTATVAASGSGAPGIPSIASFDIPAGKNRTLFIWATFERDHISASDAASGYGSATNTAGTGLGDNWPEQRVGIPPSTTTSNQITAQITGSGGSVNKKNALTIGGTPSGDLRFALITSSPMPSPIGTSYFSVSSFHIVLFENEIRTLLGGAASGTVSITLPDVTTPSSDGDEAILLASVFQNVDQTVTGFVRNALVSTNALLGTAGNFTLTPGAYDAGQIADEAHDGKLVLGVSSSTDGFLTPTGHTSIATVTRSNDGGVFGTSVGNLTNEPNGFSASAYFRNGGATPGSLYSLQAAGAATPLVYGGISTSFLLESDNADISDAPASYGNASHTIGGIRLGALVDADSSLLNNSSATGDDLNGSADEDGLIIPAELPRGTTQVITVSIQGGGGFLNGWIDWNADGDFNDPGEQVASDQAVTVGNVNLSVNVPAGASLGTSFSRFRVTSTAATGNLPMGSANTGEVEDHTILITSIVEVTGGTVNEASPWAVFGVTGTAGQLVTLSLVEGSGAGAADLDETQNLEWWNPSAGAGAGAWVPYSSYATVPAGGRLLVRVNITQERDSVFEGAETFQLSAANLSGVSASATMTINDDGSGVIYPDSPPTDPSTPATSSTGLDDDRVTPGVPEVNLRGSGISIRSGKTVFDAYDSTDFGIAKAGVGGNSVTRTFSIENVGTGSLTFPGDPVVSVTGTNASDFSVSQPSSSNIAASGSRTFTITFTPGATGIRSATVTILNNDSDESSYTFSIGGEGKANLAPIDLNFTGGRLEDGIDADETAPAASGFFTGTPDLGVDLSAAVFNTFTLVAGAGDSDNNKFTIVGNQLSLREGEDTLGSGAPKKTSFSRRPFYNIRVRVSDQDGNTFEKAFTIVVMVIRSDEGDFFVADRGPYVSTGTVVLVSKMGFIQRIFSTTIADPYEITADGNGDLIISNHEHDLSNVTALDASGIYKIDRLSGVQSKIVGGTTSGTVMPFVTPLGVKVESSGNYIVGDPDAFNFTGAVFRVNPSTSPVTITELTRGGNLDYLQGVALAPNGDIYVSNVITPVGSPSQILKIDPVSGAQTVFASAGNLIYPTGLAVESDGSAVVVVDALTKKVVSIKIPGGAQTVISSDAQFMQPTHIVIEKTGDYLVTDGKSSAVTRCVFRVDKGTGKATEVCKNGSFEQPRGVSIAK